MSIGLATARVDSFTTGGASITAETTVSVYAVNEITTGAITAGGDILLDSSAGATVTTGALTTAASGGGDITLSTAGDVVVNGLIDADGNVPSIKVFDSFSAAGIDAGGIITVVAQNGIDVAGNIIAAGDITLTTFGESLQAGEIDSTSGSMTILLGDGGDTPGLMASSLAANGSVSVFVSALGSVPVQVTGSVTSDTSSVTIQINGNGPVNVGGSLTGTSYFINADSIVIGGNLESTSGGAVNLLANIDAPALDVGGTWVGTNVNVFVDAAAVTEFNADEVLPLVLATAGSLNLTTPNIILQSAIDDLMAQFDADELFLTLDEN